MVLNVLSPSHTHTLSLSLLIWLGRPTRPLCLHRNAFICRSKVMISVWRRAAESLRTQLRFSLHPLLQPLLIFFFISPAGSWISQEQQLHYQPEMYSSILLLSSDKGTARQVTRAHGELCRKQHFSSCSAVLHANDSQIALGENHPWFEWRLWLLVITPQHSVCGVWNFISQNEDKLLIKVIWKVGPTALGISLISP